MYLTDNKNNKKNYLFKKIFKCDV